MSERADAPSARGLWSRALDCLSRREYSRAELAQRLRRGADPEEIRAELGPVLDRLEAAGLLSDARYAASRVRQQAARWGDRRLVFELRRQGIAPELIETAMAEAGDEFARALAVWRKKFRDGPAEPGDRERQIRFLAGRGFAYETIERVLSAAAGRDRD